MGQHGESLGNSTAVCSVILADPLYNGGILMCGTLQSGQDIQDARLPGPGALGQGWGKGLQVELAGGLGGFLRLRHTYVQYRI